MLDDTYTKMAHSTLRTTTSKNYVLRRTSNEHKRVA